MIIFASTSIIVTIPHPAAATPANQSSSANNPSSINAATPTLVANFTFTPTNPDVDVPVYFDASSSRSGPTSFITFYQWSWGDGSLDPSIPIESGNYRTTSHSFQLNGTFTVSLTIVDNMGATATTSRIITVNMINSNTPPAALFTYAPTKPIINQMVTFDAAASRDPDGDPVTSYYWTGGAAMAGGITPGTQFNASGAVFIHTFTATGVYVISLTVTDDHQLSSNQYTLVAVTRIPYLPGVRAGDYGKYYFSTNQTSNSGLLAVQVNVTQVAGTKVGSNFAVQFPNGTIFFAFNQTTDVYSGLGLGSFFITVVAANLTAGDGLYSYLGSFLRFNYTTTKVVAGASREVTGLTYGTSGSGSFSLEYDRLTGLLVYLAFANSGQGTEILLGDTNAWAATGNEAPLPLFYWSPDIPNSGQVVSFDASHSYDPDHDPVSSYSWTFGDGSTSSLVSPTHTYAARGNYTVTLTVGDPGGASTSASKAITVGRYVPGSISIVDDGVCNPGNVTACRFVPSSFTVSGGTLVIWANNGVLTHTVYACSARNSPTSTECPTMNEASLPSFRSPFIPSGGTFPQTLDTPGTYYYYCAIHPWMHGEVIVTAPQQSFSLSAFPGTIFIARGQSSTAEIAVSSINGFSGTVSLTAYTGLPQTPSFNPSSVYVPNNGYGYSQMTITIPAGTPTGDYNITIAGTSGSIYEYTSVVVTVTLGQVIAPTISSVSAITTNTQATIIIQGSGFGNTPPQTTTIFDGSVDTVQSSTTPSLAIWDNLTQSGWTWQAGHDGNLIGIYLTSWSNNTIVIGGFGSALHPGTRDNSGTCTGPTWTICVGDHITVGVWGPNNSGTAHYNLTVTGSRDFALSANPQALSIQPGQTQSTQIVLDSLSGFNGTVRLTAQTGLSQPPSFNPANVTVTSNSSSHSTMTIIVPANTPSGFYDITVTGTSGNLTHSTRLLVTIGSPGDFSVSANPSSLRIPQGYTNNTSIIVTSIRGFTGTVQISLNGLPPDSLWSNPSSVTLVANQTAAINLNENLPSYAPVGNYTIVITGTSGSITHTFSIPVIVVPSDLLPGFRLSILPTTISIAQGSSVTAHVVLRSLNGYSGTVSLKNYFSDLTTTFGSDTIFLPSGATVNTTLTISAGAHAPASYTINVEGFTANPPNSGPYDSTSATVTITSPIFDFSLTTPSPNSLNVVQGLTSPSSLIRVDLLSGTAALVTFSASGLPPGVTATFTNNPCSPTCTVTVSFSASATATLGTTTVDITVTSGPVSHSTTLSLTVSASAVFDFSLSSPSPGSLTAVQGSTSLSSSFTATLASGTTTHVIFSATGLPTGVTANFNNSPCAPTCTTTVSFSASEAAELGTTSVTIEASGGGVTHTATLQITVTPNVLSVTFTGIDYSGAMSIYALGINNNGQVVGYYSSTTSVHGYLLSGDGGSFSTIDHPSASSTIVYGISSNGTAVGSFCPITRCYLGVANGFVRVRANYTEIKAPSACSVGGQTASSPYGISSDGTLIVGSVEDCSGFQHGWLLSHGTFTTIDYPGSGQNLATGVNDAGQIVGFDWTGSGPYQGWSYSNGAFTSINYPGAASTRLQGINGAGDIVGFYTDKAGTSHAFLLSGGRFSTIDYPGATYTDAYGVNDAGQIVGSYTDASGKAHGYIAATRAVSTTSVACMLSTLTIGASTTCTVQVTGSNPAGTVVFTQDGSGSVTLSASFCTLSSGTCSVTLTGTAAGSLSVKATYAGDSHNAGSEGSASLSVVAKASASVTVSCSPSSVNVGRFTTCSVTVTGSSPSGAVTFATSSSTGVFTPANSECTLSAGACSVTYADTATASLTAVITASYTGDNANTAGSGTFSVDISKLAGTIAVGTTSSTVTNGGVTANQGTVTGVSVTITGATEANGTPVGVTTQTLSAPSAGVGTPNLTSPSYYDVLVTGITTGNAQVCISFTSASSGTTMQYWDGTTWTTASNITVNGSTVCGTIPVSALTGTNIALANQAQPVPPAPANYTILYIGAGVAIVVLVGVFLALRRRRGSTRITR